MKRLMWVPLVSWGRPTERLKVAMVRWDWAARSRTVMG